MELAKCTLVITPENQQVVYDLTPADALILHTLHFKEAKGVPLKDIVITGEAMTEVTAARPALPPEFDLDHHMIRPAQRGVPATYRPRTQAEERALLQRFYTGALDGKPVFKALFPSPVEKLPETFAEIADAIGNPTITDGRSQPEAPAEAAPEEPSAAPTEGEGEQTAEPAPSRRRR